MKDKGGEVWCAGERCEREQARDEVGKVSDEEGEVSKQF